MSVSFKQKIKNGKVNVKKSETEKAKETTDTKKNKKKLSNNTWKAKRGQKRKNKKGQKAKTNNRKRGETRTEKNEKNQISRCFVCKFYLYLWLIVIRIDSYYFSFEYQRLVELIAELFQDDLLKLKYEVVMELVHLSLRE